MSFLKILIIFYLLFFSLFYSYSQSEINKEDTVVVYNINELLSIRLDSLGEPDNSPWGNFSESYYTKKNDSTWIYLSYEEANGDECGECEQIYLLLILNKNDTGNININDVIDFRTQPIFLDSSYFYNGFVRIEKIKKKKTQIKLDFIAKKKGKEIIVKFNDVIPNYGYNKRVKKFSLIYDWFILNNQK